MKNHYSNQSWQRSLSLFLQPILPLVLTWVCLQFVLADSTTSSTSTSTIPRTTDWNHDYSMRYPPWNPSPLIDEDGFLYRSYRRIPGEWEKEADLHNTNKKSNKNQQQDDNEASTTQNVNNKKTKSSKNKNKRKRGAAAANSIHLPVNIRQVPGDGNCLFHSISTCLAHSVNGTHLDLRNMENLQWLYQSSTLLRQQAVDCLERKSRKLLYMQGDEYMRANDLVEAAASQYGMSGSDYCRLMRQNSYWGGGPEIVALCNVLKRPIHVYELHVRNDQFVLRRMACFGTPKFESKEALHILSADSRFPDVVPGDQSTTGDHFLALFPIQKEPMKPSSKKLRGGEASKRKYFLQQQQHHHLDHHHRGVPTSLSDDDDYDGSTSRLWGRFSRFFGRKR